MRVCILNEFFYPDMMGGTPKVLSELASKLDERGVEVCAVTSRNSYRDPKVRFTPFEKWQGVEIHRVSAPHWTAKRLPQRMAGNLLFTHRAARKTLRDVKCDVVLVSTAPATLPMAAQAYFRRRGVPYVYVVYDLDPDRAVAIGVAEASSLPVKTLATHQRKWLHGAAAVVAIGRCMKEHLIKAYGVPAERIHVIEVGADADSIRPKPRESGFRQKHGLNGFVILYSGNFGKYHDFDTLLDAAKLVSGKSSDVNFLLVGRGAKLDHLKARVASEKIDNVRFLDFVPDEAYEELLAAADMCLVTLEAGMEGLCVPSKFYSILAAGRPTLAVMNPQCEVAYTVDGEDVGTVVGLGEPDLLAQKILELSSQGERLEDQGVRSRALLEAKYSTDAISEKFRALLGQVAQGSEKGLSMAGGSRSLK